MFVGEQISIESAARIVHIAMLLVSFLIVIMADLTAAKSIRKTLTQKDITSLHKLHGALTLGLMFFWLSGLILVDILTGFVWEEFSPKLVAKIAVVTILSINAILIGRLALPFYEKNQDMLFGEFTAPQRLRLASCGAVSAASWFSAFCLGAVESLQTAGPETLIGLLATIYIAALTGGAVLAALTGRRGQSRRLTTREPVFGTSRNITRNNSVMTTALRA